MKNNGWRADREQVCDTKKRPKLKQNSKLLLRLSSVWVWIWLFNRSVDNLASGTNADSDVLRACHSVAPHHIRTRARLGPPPPPPPGKKKALREARGDNGTCNLWGEPEGRNKECRRDSRRTEETVDDLGSDNYLNCSVYRPWPVELSSVIF